MRATSRANTWTRLRSYHATSYHVTLSFASCTANIAVRALPKKPTAATTETMARAGTFETSPEIASHVAMAPIPIRLRLNELSTWIDVASASEKLERVVPTGRNQ